MVSGTLSLPSRGSFHLSLTVLYSIGHQVVFSLRRWSSYIPTGFHVSRGTLDTHHYTNHFAYETVTLFRPAFQLCSAMFDNWLCESVTPSNIAIQRFRLFPVCSPLLRKSIVFFLFLRVLRCFSSPGSPLYTMYSCIVNSALPLLSSLIRISTDQCSFATPRGFSQLVTSFFGAWCQGILPMPLLA